jgi:hypothetical protein
MPLNLSKETFRGGPYTTKSGYEYTCNIRSSGIIGSLMWTCRFKHLMVNFTGFSMIIFMMVSILLYLHELSSYIFSGVIKMIG